ncbi:MAG: hypothetical protein U5K54_11330 [Cytophagales bacterium]|nr:hypothetical protein [Cytophagales bacterium]
MNQASEGILDSRDPMEQKVQYWGQEPMGKKEGTAYPTILNIHGGPSAMWGPVFFLCGTRIQFRK